MCFALFIAAQAFFLGQADELPEALRIPALLMLPIVAVFLAMVYWLWRVHTGRARRLADAPEGPSSAADGYRHG